MLFSWRVLETFAYITCLISWSWRCHHLQWVCSLRICCRLSLGIVSYPAVVIVTCQSSLVIFLLHFHSQSLSTPLLQTHLIHRQLILIEKCKILILNLTLKSYTMHNPMHFPLLKVPLQSNSISAINKSMPNMPPGTQNYR